MVIETGKIATPAVLDAGVNEEAASNGDSHFPVNERNSDLSPVLEQERIGRRLLGSGVLVAHKSRPTRGKKKSRRRFKSAKQC